MVLLLLSAALADSVTLDNGVVLQVDLARYELHGDCQMSVMEGELTGAILIVPCQRVRSFERTAEALVLAALPLTVVPDPAEQAWVSDDGVREVDLEGDIEPLLEPGLEDSFEGDAAPKPRANPEPRPTAPASEGRAISF
jgi:hypothetical protein